MFMYVLLLELMVILLFPWQAHRSPVIVVLRWGKRRFVPRARVASWKLNKNDSSKLSQKSRNTCVNLLILICCIFNCGDMLYLVKHHTFNTFHPQIVAAGYWEHWVVMPPLNKYHNTIFVLWTCNVSQFRIASHVSASFYN